MKYFKHIDIGAAELAIRECVLENCKLDIGTGAPTVFHKNSLICTFIADQLPKLGIPDFVVIFTRPPNATCRIHIDGDRVTGALTNELALNIPIYNCDGSVMNWYGGDYSVVFSPNGRDSPHLFPKWNTPPFIAASTIINTPTIVRVNTPHDAMNTYNQTRLIISIRFKDGTALATNFNQE